MVNTNEMTMEKAQAIAAAVMNDVRASGAKIETKEEMYETVCKYVQMTKEQFETLYNELKNCSHPANCNEELSENELDTVVGGSAWDWVKDNAGTIGMIVGAAALVVAVCATAGAGIGVLGYGIGFFKATAVTMAECEAALSMTAASAALGGAIGGAKMGLVAVAAAGAFTSLQYGLEAGAEALANAF